VSNKNSLAKLDASRSEAEERRGTRDFLVQHGAFAAEAASGSINEEVIVLPALVGDQSSRTMLESIEERLKDNYLSLRKLADEYPVVFCHLAFDGAPGNDLVFVHRRKCFRECHIAQIEMPNAWFE
jgi:hypothetical protein